jgi:AraC-like DNA-binding protein
VRYHRLRLAHRTKAFLEAYLAQPIQIAELCAATGASMKSLERAFLEIHDVTPKRFLTVWRMSRARRALLAEAKDRISVALGCLRLVLLNAIVLVAEI